MFFDTIYFTMIYDYAHRMHQIFHNQQNLIKLLNCRDLQTLQFDDILKNSTNHKCLIKLLNYSNNLVICISSSNSMRVAFYGVNPLQIVRFCNDYSNVDC